MKRRYRLDEATTEWQDLRESILRTLGESIDQHRETLVAGIDIAGHIASDQGDAKWPLVRVRWVLEITRRPMGDAGGLLPVLSVKGVAS